MFVCLGSPPIAVQDKLDHMVFVWNDIHALLDEREAKLLDVMDLAEKFWCDHCALIITIKDTQDLLKDLEEPGVDPSVVKQQQESVEVSFYCFCTSCRKMSKSDHTRCDKSIFSFKVDASKMQMYYMNL